MGRAGSVSYQCIKVTYGPVVVALNKADLAGQAAYDRAEARKITDSLHADCLLTSAKTGEGVEEAFRRLGEAILRAPHPSPATG